MANPSSRLKNSVYNILTGFGTRLLITVLRFITRTVFIHTLGKNYLGINGYFSDILSMLSLAELGLDTALNFKLYKPLAEGDDKRVRVVMKFYKQAYRVIGVAIFAMGICLIPFLPRLIKDYDNLCKINVDVTLIFLLFLFKSSSSYLFFAYRSAIMKANQKRYILDIADYGLIILTNIVQIVVLYLYNSFLLYTISAIFFSILTNIINAIITHHFYPQFFTYEPDSLGRKEILDLIKDCGALFLFKVNAVVLKATDNIVLGYFVGLGAVGLYSNYLILYNALYTLLDRLKAGIRASVGNLFAVSNIPSKYRFFEVMNFLTIILFGTASVGMAVCANELIEAWIGKEFVVSKYLPLLIGIELLFYGLRNNLGLVRNVSGLFRQMWYRPLIGALCNVVISVILVQYWQISGVIIGTISADIISTFALDPAIIYKHAFNNYRSVWDYYKKHIVYFLVLAAVCGMDYWLNSFIFAGYGWLSVIIHGAIVLVTVPGTMFILFRNTYECKYLMQVAHTLLQKVLKHRIDKKPV